MHEQRPVFVMGVEPRITVPVARSLHRLGVPVFVASTSTADSTLRSRAIARFVRWPDPIERPDDFLHAVSDWVKTTGADILMPATDRALSVIAKHYETLKSLLHVACPPPAVVDRVLNKQTTLRIAESIGVRVPHQYVVSDRTDTRTIRQMLFPVIAKPQQKRSAEPFKVRYYRAPEELMDALDDGVLQDAIVQEYCEGCGVGIEMLVHHGNCVAAFQHRRLREFPKAGGVAVTAVAEALDPGLAETALKLLRALEWEGVAMVEFRYDRQTGTAVLMEVNGRYWGTVSLPIQAGIDFPAYQWQLVHGETPEVPGSYAAGMTWHWSAGSVKRWHEALKSRHSVSLGDCQTQDTPAVRKRQNALWTTRDPLPALFELFDTARRLLVSDFRAVLSRMAPRSGGFRSVQSNGKRFERGQPGKHHYAK